MGSTRRMAFLAVLIVFFPVLELKAQATTVFGEVTDSATGEALPFVQLSFLNSNEGTSTDKEGRYRLESENATDTLVFSLLGYRKERVAIERGEEQRLDIKLAPKWVEFEGVEIRPSDRENPAHPIMRKVIERKDSNAPGSASHYEYEVYNKLNIGMGVRENVVESKLLKPFRFVFENIDSSGPEPYLPIFVSETLSKVYFRNEPRAKKEYIQASHTSGIENPSVTKYMGNMYQELDIYDNNIPIFDKAFKSPIADGGFNFYDYYLLDSSVTDGVPSYRIRFQPRRKHELTFEGELLIDGNTFGIEEVRASMVPGANINYIREFEFEQRFERFEGSHWMLTGNDLNVRAAVLIPHSMRWQHFFAHREARYDEFSFEPPPSDSVYTSTDDIAIERYGPGKEDSTKKGRSYWEKNRPAPLTENEEAVYWITDSIKQMPQYKVVRSFLRGYAELGPLEFGPFFSFYSFNEIEGNRFRFGMRSHELFGGRANLNAYMAYGTKDEQFKYGGGFRYFFQRSPTWHFAGVSYRKDLQQLGQGQSLLKNDNILNSTFRRRPIDRLNAYESFRAFYSKEWKIGLSARIEGRQRTIAPRGGLEFYRPLENGSKEEVNGIRTTELSLSTHFGFKEKFYTTSYRRIGLGSTHPLIDLNYTHGFDDLLGSDHGFRKLEGRYSHRVRTGYPGTFEYGFTAGKIWGALPYPLLELHDGNETYFLNPQAFNLMNYYEFVSDEYLSMSLTHHFEGLFLNRIPLLRKLNLRTVVSGKALVGSFSDANREKMILPDDLYTLDAEGGTWKKPYAEASVGIENIMSFIRVDGVWRLNYLDHPNITPFGVRATVQFGF